MKKWRRRITTWVFVLGIGALVAWALAQRALGPRVRVLRAHRGPVVQTVVASGRVYAPARVNLAGVVSGVVRAVNAREGEVVHPGQVLVELDDAELAAQVAQARAGVASAVARLYQIQRVSARAARASVQQSHAALAQARANLQRAEFLFRSGAATQQQLDDARQAVTTAQSAQESAAVQVDAASPMGSDARLASASRAQAEAALRLAEVRLAQARIRSPVEAVLVTRAVEPGDVAQPGRTLLVLLPVGETLLSVQPDERNLAQLRAGQHAMASTEAFGDERFDAVLTYLAPVVDPQRGTIEVRFRVPTPPAYLRPDMTVSVEVEVGRRDDVLTLPATAVRDAASSAPWVLVLRGARAVRQPVSLGLRGERVVEVTAGLGAEDSVIPPSEARAQDGRPARLVAGGG